MSSQYSPTQHDLQRGFPSSSIPPKYPHGHLFFGTHAIQSSVNEESVAQNQPGRHEHLLFCVPVHFTLSNDPFGHFLH
ncbi:hypothetical protein pCPXV0045 [Cowpox virus]|uniref:Uncharacterized protein n=1 Tax=Cowpox virus TaxID=10243 RepID=A0A2R8F6M8_COWPX|nr:hypothetical protein pCPXV0045 [Cowpox virus]